MDLFSVTWGQRKFLWQIISVLSNNPAADSSIGNDLAGTSKYIIILSTQTMHLRTPYLKYLVQKNQELWYKLLILESHIASF